MRWICIVAVACWPVLISFQGIKDSSTNRAMTDKEIEVKLVEKGFISERTAKRMVAWKKEPGVRYFPYSAVISKDISNPMAVACGSAWLACMYLNVRILDIYPLQKDGTTIAAVIILEDPTKG